MYKLFVVGIAAALLAGCGEDRAVERTWTWETPSGLSATSVAVLPNGQLFVGTAGEAGRGVFLSKGGKKLGQADFASLCDDCAALIPGHALNLGEKAWFGNENGLIRVDPAEHRLRYLPLENPRNLQFGALAVDGRFGTTLPDGSAMLVPGGTLVQISGEALVTASHPLDGVSQAAWVRDDEYLVLVDDSVAIWKQSTNAVETLVPSDVVRFSAATFDVAAVIRDGDALSLATIHPEGLRPVGEVRFDHEVEIAVVPGKHKMIVGVTDRALGTPVEHAPPPGTVMIFDTDGTLLGRSLAGGPIEDLAVDAKGNRAFAAHGDGVTAFDLN